MWFVVIGTALLALKVAEIGPFPGLSWWWVALPFGLAIVWWSWSDASGLTRKREMDKLDRRKEERRRRNLVALGIDPRMDKRTRVFREKRAQIVQQAETRRPGQQPTKSEVVESFVPETRQGEEGPGRGPNDL